MGDKEAFAAAKAMVISMSGTAYDNRTSDGQSIGDIKSKESLQKFVRRSRNRKSLGKLGRMALFVALAAVFVTLAMAAMFRVRTIEVAGTTRYSAQQVIVVSGISEGDSLFSSPDLSVLHDRLPYIKSAKISRKLPYTITITVSEDSAGYYCELYGEYFALSEDLRVLERADSDEGFVSDGYVRLELPAIDSAVVGGRIVFESDADDKYVSAYVSAMQDSTLKYRVTAFDLRDKFDLKLICDGIYLVEIGDGEDLATKLSTTVAVLSQTEAFPANTKAKIDMTNPASPSAIVSDRVDVSFN